jgi:hypothetical protein
MIYGRQIETAKRLIKKYGQLVTWKKSLAVSDTSEPWKEKLEDEDEETLEIDVYILFLPVGRINTEFQMFFQGTEIIVGNLKGLMANVDFEPNAKDVVIRSGEEIRIKNISPIEPSGIPILYTIEFDK